MPQKEEDWDEDQLVIFYEQQLVIGQPCKSLILAPPCKLLVPVVLGHPCKCLPCIYHGHPWKWVQVMLSGVALETVMLAWVGIVLWWDGLLEMLQLFSILKILHGQL